VDGKEQAPKLTMKLDPLVRQAPLHVAVIGPQNATVKIDGREVSAGHATYDGQITVGEQHVITAEAPNYVVATQTVSPKDVDPINVTLQLSADQAKGKLVVVAKPDGATIEIDGKAVGAT